MKKKILLFLLTALTLSGLYALLHSPNLIRQGYKGARLGDRPTEIPNMKLAWEDEEDLNAPKFYERAGETIRTVNQQQYIQYVFFKDKLFFISMSLETLPASDTIYTWLRKTYGIPAEDTGPLNTHQLQIWEQGSYKLSALQERLDGGNLLNYTIEYLDKDMQEKVDSYEKERR